MNFLSNIAYRDLGANALSALVFGLIGIVLMVLGFKAFDWVTPKLDVEAELSEKRNIAVAIVIAAVILGISYIVAKIVSA
jgi:putative membrane protein